MYKKARTHARTHIHKHNNNKHITIETITKHIMLHVQRLLKSIKCFFDITATLWCVTCLFVVVI